MRLEEEFSHCDHYDEEEEPKTMSQCSIGALQQHQQQKFVVVGYALTSKKIKSFLQPKFEGLARWILGLMFFSFFWFLVFDFWVWLIVLESNVCDPKIENMVPFDVVVVLVVRNENKLCEWHYIKHLNSNRPKFFDIFIFCDPCLFWWL